MVLSDWPSVCGWKAVLKCNLVPIASCSFGQNQEVKRGSLSDTMDTGAPCSLTISSTYNCAYLSREWVLLVAMKWADFVNLSTITQIASCPRCVLGSPVTKSIVILSHFYSGMDKGCSKPAGFLCSILIC